MTSPKSVRKRRKQLHARDVRGLVAFCFYPLEGKIVNKSRFQSIFQVQTTFTPISRQASASLVPGIWTLMMDCYNLSLATSFLYKEQDFFNFLTNILVFSE